MSEICKLIEAENPMMKVRLSGCSPDLDRNEIEQKLFGSMNYYQGIGLSANQIGVMERVFIMYEDINTRKILTCFNPKIIEISKEDILPKLIQLTFIVCQLLELDLSDFFNKKEACKTKK